MISSSKLSSNGGLGIAVCEFFPPYSSASATHQHVIHPVRDESLKQLQLRASSVATAGGRRPRRRVVSSPQRRWFLGQCLEDFIEFRLSIRLLLIEAGVQIFKLRLKGCEGLKSHSTGVAGDGSAAFGGRGEGFAGCVSNCRYFKHGGSSS